MMIRQLLKKLVFPILKPLAHWYFSSVRWYCYDGLKVRINPGVFFPSFTISTGVLLDYLSERKLSDLSILELGAGCGIISFHCAKKGADVTASDISIAAIENLRQNEESLKAGVTVLHSDLFESIFKQFDLIIVNPPYYPKNPANEAEKAWYCGEEFQYFHELEKQLKAHLTKGGYALMILSEDCQIETIKTIMEKGHIGMERVFSTVKFCERNFIYSLK